MGTPVFPQGGQEATPSFKSGRHMDIPSTEKSTEKSTASTSAYQASTVIADRYVVERELGHGGMATVYLCTDQRTGANVAVKVLRQELGSAVVIERFLREIAFASELDHPRIPKVLDSGVIGELPYYVMTYIEGESLRSRLEREKQLPLSEAIRITCDVIDPTAYAHKQGIVHRDIKPDNILIGPGGVYVMDFGIARAIVESGIDRLTSTGIGVGTPAYMSPEQALGDRNLDARSDIYSLGCVLYEMIAGMPPFVGPTAQVIISRRFAAAPPPIAELRQGVPESVEVAISRALARAPADRWATVSEFGDALHACITDGSRSRSLNVVFRRRSLMYATAAVIVLALVAAGIVAWTREARGALEKGQAAMRSWDFRTAEKQFRKAVDGDADDGAAQLGLAQTLMLLGRPSSEWKPNILAASDHRENLPPDARGRIDALASIASGNYAAGCKGLAAATRSQSHGQLEDFTPALALADCAAADKTVLPDGDGQSGYRFQSSYQLADSIYEGLLERHANAPSAYAVLLPRLEKVLSIDKSTFRRGESRGPPAESFLALPRLLSDTLAYIPFPISGKGAPWRTLDAASIDAALSRNRQRLRTLAEAWSRVAPGEPRAHELLASVLEAMGALEGDGNTALEQLRQARSLASSGSGSAAERYVAQLQVGSDQVRLYLHLSRFDQAGLLADSILSLRMPVLDDSARVTATNLLTPLAALRGRALQVIDLNQKGVSTFPYLLPNNQVGTLPPAVVPDMHALSGYVEAGGSADTIRAIAARIDETLSSFVAAAQVDAVRKSALMRPLTLAAPVLGAKPLADLGPTLDPFGLALRAFARHDMPKTRRFLDSLAVLHADYAPGEITMDAVYGEAWLRAQIGDSVAASAMLDKALRGLPAALPSILGSSVVAFSLVRVMALRAEMAAQTGQTALAKKWAKAVIQLWGRGDAVTAETLERMRRLQ
jgi:hypothetical protein